MSIAPAGPLPSRDGWRDDDATLAAKAQLVLALARVLYVNGQATEETLEDARKLGDGLALHSTVMARWGELELQTGDDGDRLVITTPADPVGVNMNRVIGAIQAVRDIRSRRIETGAAAGAIEAAAQAPAAPTWQFVLAAGAGADALAVLFGAQHMPAYALIFLSAAGGAIVRRTVARYSTNDFLQPFLAALLAGVIGAVAVRFDLSSSLRLVAVCPCMILVPGPHVLNGGTDLLQGRMHLGASRLLFASLVVLAISTGLLLGLSVLGVELPVDPKGRNVSLWLDMIAAGVAVGAYSVFFSTPARMLAWPVAVGVLAHAFRWLALSQFRAGAATSALVACLTVGAVLTPVARRNHMPFAAIGFASVVSMIPGVFLFRMWSGLVQIGRGSDVSSELLSSTVSDGITAATIIFAMTLGLIVPKLLIDRMSRRSPDSLHTAA